MAAGVLFALVLLSVVAFLTWEMHRAVRQAQGDAESAASPHATIHTIDLAAPAGVDAVGAPAAFRDAIAFHGHLFIAGSQALVEYDAGT